MSTIKRRAFLKSSAIAVGMTVIPSSAAYAQGKSAATSYAANEKLNIGIIGSTGRGAANLGGVAHENIVAMCDVDAKKLASAAASWFRNWPTRGSSSAIASASEVGSARQNGVIAAPPRP